MASKLQRREHGNTNKNTAQKKIYIYILNSTCMSHSERANFFLFIKIGGVIPQFAYCRNYNFGLFCCLRLLLKSD